MLTKEQREEEFMKGIDVGKCNCDGCGKADSKHACLDCIDHERGVAKQEEHARLLEEIERKIVEVTSSGGQIKSNWSWWKNTKKSLEGKQ